MHEPYLQPDSEIVIGLVAPVGADLEIVQSILHDCLEQHFRYTPDVIRLSALISQLDDLETELHEKPPLQRFQSYMDAGNEARRRSGRGDILALSAAAQIGDKREREGDRSRPLPRTAHILRSLKHPDEVHTLRRIYGLGFFLLGIHAPYETRKQYLVNDKNIDEADAVKLLQRDEAEGNEFGQRTRDTYELCDAYVPLPTDESSKRQLWRVLDLLFGRPDVTPTKDEHAMFMAYASSLRSGDLSRQVGAVVTSRSGEVLGLGANDVPRFGGGLYWSDDDPDHRDWHRGYDSNERERGEIAASVIQRLSAEDTSGDHSIDAEISDLAGTGLQDLTEFGRAVHAEMEALLACARTGSSPLGGTLYSTTFPCHNCAKHIVAAGLHRVVYVEPYPKSKALKLHDDAITLGGEDHKVSFEPFVGVGPRRFIDLFSLRLSNGRRIARKSKNRNGEKAEWSKDQLRVPMPPLSYLEREELATRDLDRAIKGAS